MTLFNCHYRCKLCGIKCRWKQTAVRHFRNAHFQEMFDVVDVKPVRERVRQL